MNNRLFITLLAISGLTIGSCTSNSEHASSGYTEENATGLAGHESHSDMDMALHEHQQGLEDESGEPSDESIYHSQSSWLDRHGNDVSLSDLQGRIQVVAMVYTHCEYACPRILADMKRIENALSGDIKQKTNFVIISIDPERDVPERLAEFADENSLDDENWTLLNGGEWDILEVAALLGVKYKRISDTDFTHSNMISVLNREGEIVHQRKELSDSQAEIIQAIENQ